MADKETHYLGHGFARATRRRIHGRTNPPWAISSGMLHCIIECDCRQAPKALPLRGNGDACNQPLAKWEGPDERDSAPLQGARASARGERIQGDLPSWNRILSS